MAKVLGKGLEALIKNYSSNDKENQTQVRIDDVVANKHQPRISFDSNKMQMLINSIKTKGIIQPLTVRKKKNNKYELIAGERRLRAAKAAGLKHVPVFILSVNNLAEMMEYALIENIQRVDLNPIEEAEGYLVLQDKYNFTQNKIAQSVSKSRSEIANKLRLLKLPKVIQIGLLKNKIYYGHARTILSIKNKSRMLEVFKQIINNKLNTRQTEALVKKYQESNIINKKQKTIEFAKQEQALQKTLKTQVLIQANKKTKGSIKIKFKNKNELKNLINKILG